MKQVDEVGRIGLRSMLKGMLMLAVFAAAVVAARKAGLGDMLGNTQWFADHVLGRGPLSILIFVGVCTGFSALGLPRQLLAFLGGFAFGMVGGALLATLGCGLGCALAAGYARFFGKKGIVRRFGPRVQKVDRFLSHQPFNMALALRLFPLGSNLITNLAAGVSSIPLLPFVLGSSIGYLPQNFIFALFGAGMNAESRTGVILSVGMSVALFVASGLVGMAAYRRYRAEAAGVVDEE